MANRELVKFLSDVLGVPKSSLTIEKGAPLEENSSVLAGLL